MNDGGGGDLRHGGRRPLPAASALDGARRGRAAARAHPRPCPQPGYSPLRTHGDRAQPSDQRSKARSARRRRRKDPGAPPRTPALSQRWVLTRSSPRPARQSPTPEPPGRARARYARPYGHTLARPGEPGAARRVPDRGDDLPDTLRERIDGASRTATTRVTCRSGHGSARTSWAGRGRQIGAAMACPAGKGSI